MTNTQMLVVWICDYLASHNVDEKIIEHIQKNCGVNVPRQEEQHHNK